MPENLSPETPLGMQYTAYKRFIELGGLTVTASLEHEAKVVLSEKEAYGYFMLYYSKYNAPRRPYELCDKSLCIDFYNNAGIETLKQTVVQNESDFDAFLDCPVIMKPRLSGGGISSNELAYRIFDTGLELLTTIKQEQPDFFKTQVIFLEQGNLFEQLVLQQAVVKSTETYGQLYIEGFINGNGEVFFSSTHEIEFKECRWTAQLELTDKDAVQISQLKESLTKLISNASMTNSLFLLQCVRDVKTGKWYPNDWQYRLSYASLWGRQHFEESYCRNLVAFMTDQVPSVTEKTIKFYFQKYFVVDTTKSKQNLIEKMKEYSIIYAPFGKSQHESSDKFLFIASGDTFAQAKMNMEEFEKAV